MANINFTMDSRVGFVWLNGAFYTGPVCFGVAIPWTNKIWKK